MANVTATGRHKEGSDLYVLARITDSEDSIIQQADVSTITYQVWRLDARPTPSKTKDTTSLTVADVVYNTLQTDAGWTEDDTGYNFKATIAANSFTAISNTDFNESKVRAYRVEAKFTLTGGEVFYVFWEPEVEKVLTS